MSIPLIPPMLATTSAVTGDRAAQCWEVKLRTRTGREVSESLPELVGLVDTLAGRSVVLDGELVACPDGRPDCYPLGPTMTQTGRHARWAASQTPVTFVAFDLSGSLFHRFDE